MTLNTPPDIVINATLGTVSGVPRSTASGSTGKIGFEVDTSDVEELWPLVGQVSLALTFSGAELGDGWTISGLRVRPDADGQARAFVLLICPETTTPTLGLLFARHLVGTAGQLVMVQTQTTLDAQLTTQAPERA